MDLVVRPAMSADLEAAHALIESAYRGEAAKRGWSHEADLLGGQRTDEAMLAEIVADPRQTLLLAFDGAALVGCVLLRDQGDGRAYLGLLTVNPTRQAAGLGRWLLQTAEGHARDAFGADRIDMTVIRQRPELIAYYERRGYARTGDTAPFPIDDPRFGLPMVEGLEFVILEKRL